MPNTRKTIIAAVAAACFIGLVAGAYFGYQEYRDRQMQAQVSKHLKDPASAEFRNLSRNGPAICGELNAKNGFGGYVGFAAFILVDGQPLMLAPHTAKKSPSPEERLVELEENIDFLKAYTAHCPADSE